MAATPRKTIHGSPPATPRRSSPGRSSPSPPSRRRSLGSLHSPVAIAERAIDFAEFERTADDVAHFVNHHQEMCTREGRSDIFASYALKKLTRSDIWRIDDARGKLFGFALTQEHPKRTPPEIELHLICSKKRKGEGGALFRRILEHARARGMELILEAINGPVARNYIKYATEIGFEVEVNDASSTTTPLDEYVRQQEANYESIFLRFRSP